MSLYTHPCPFAVIYSLFMYLFFIYLCDMCFLKICRYMSQLIYRPYMKYITNIEIQYTVGRWWKKQDSKKISQRLMHLHTPDIP